MNRRAVTVLVVLTGALSVACAADPAADAPCSIRDVEAIDGPTSDTVADAIEDAVAEGDLDLTDVQLEALVAQLAGVENDDAAPNFYVGVDGLTVRVQRTADTWQVIEREEVLDC